METILIADDHEIVRLGIRMMIETISPNYQFIETSTCAGVLQALSNQPVQYTILDMMLADGNIFSSLHLIARFSQRTNIFVYSMNAETVYAKRLFEKGVRGFISKTARMEELEKAIRDLLKGESYLSPELRDHVLSSSGNNMAVNPVDTLTDRELEVAEYLVAGMGAKEISHKLHIEISTVSTFRRRAFDKLNVRNVLDLKKKLSLYKFH